MQTEEQPERLGRVFKATVALAAALLIGALGNGIWEFFLKDLLIALGNAVLTLTSSVWSGYLDVLHREIGKLRADSLVLLPFSFFAVVLFLAPIILTVYIIMLLRRLTPGASVKPVHSRSSVASTVLRLRLTVYGLVVPSVVALSLLNIVELSESMYSRRAGVWADRCIEIVAPKISPQAHISLRAELRSIETASQFYALHKQLTDIARQSDTVLPKFTPVGMPNAP